VSKKPKKNVADQMSRMCISLIKVFKKGSFRLLDFVTILGLWNLRLIGFVFTLNQIKHSSQCKAHVGFETFYFHFAILKLLT
jgi:hypothetical protein